MSVATIIATASATSKPLQPNSVENVESDVSLLHKLRNPSELQLRLEKQLKKSRKVKAEIPRKTIYDHKVIKESEKVPLVSGESSDDYFEDVNLKSYDDEVVIFKQPVRTSNRTFSDYSSDCTDQLLRDGFRLDELSDDEDLDLIPPKPAGTTWCACENYSCSLQ